MFASEKEFPNLANPMQLSFDNKGRLWVAVMPTYPHYRPGDAMPSNSPRITMVGTSSFSGSTRGSFEHMST